MNKNYPVKIEAYVGGNSAAFHEMTLNPYEGKDGQGVVIYKDGEDNNNEIWIRTDMIDDMIESLTSFRDTLNKLGYKTKEDASNSD